MRKPWTNAIIASSLIMSLTTHADFVGLNIGSSFWRPDISGSFNSTNNASNEVSVKNTNQKSHQSVTISFEHPIPAVPNIKFKNAPLSSSSSSNITGSVNFDNKSFTGSISSTLDVSHKDLVLYYELLDNWVNLDLGLNFKVFEGEVAVNDANNNGTININETIPVVYVAARFDLPFTGFYVGADIQNISLLTDSSSEDSTLMVGYETASGLGIEGGYKTFSLKLDEASNNINTSLDYDGLYINGYIHF